MTNRVRRPGTAARVASAAGVGGLALAAVAVAVCGAFVHRWAEPVGLLLAVGGATSLAVLARVCARSRLGSAVVAVAWLAPTIVLAQSAPGEDVVITGSTGGLVLLFGGSVSHAIALGMGADVGRGRIVT